jgi:Tol biopolymer transport system component
MKIWVAVVLAYLLSPASPQKIEPRDAYGNDLPIMAGASLLVGNPPFFLMVTNAHENLMLQRESNQPETRDGTSVYPSISRDGKTIAYARVKAGSPERILAISTYDATAGKRTDYSEGEYSGSVAISPDASRLAFSAAQQREGGPGDNHMHIIDLKTGQESLGPAVSPQWPVFASWSPDSNRLVYSFNGEVRVWNSATGAVSTIAEGDLPAWSPSGEWIAYLEGAWDSDLKRFVFMPGEWGPRCLVVHPDGTGGKTVLNDPHRKKFARVLVEPPVWSPDSRSILLNELANVDTGAVNIDILDLRTMKPRTALKNSLRVLGWVVAN